MSAKRILVLGGGFAGLWSAVGAARKLDELGEGPDTVEVTLVNRDAFHSIRVRNYESDLTPVRVPLDDVLGPVGVRRVEGDVTGIDLTGQAATVTAAGGQQALFYDRLVFASAASSCGPPSPAWPSTPSTSIPTTARPNSATTFSRCPAIPNPAASLRSSWWVPV